MPSRHTAPSTRPLSTLPPASVVVEGLHHVVRRMREDDQMTLEAVADGLVAAVRAHLGVDHAGLSLLSRHGDLRTIAATGGIVADFDDLQVRQGGGPVRACLLDLSGRSGRTGLGVHDVMADQRWRELAACAASWGIREVVFAPAGEIDRAQGVLALYSAAVLRRPPEWRDLVATVAAASGAALDAAAEIAHLRRALEHRTVIGQAQGLLMARYDVDAARALDLMRRFSSHRNRKLHLVAADLVRRDATPRPSPGG